MIPLHRIKWNEKDIESVNKIIRSGRDWAKGKEIKLFEKKLAKYVGVKNVIVVNSGTSALHAILLSLGINKEDEVIVPSFTFIATANCVLMVGAKPIFADIEEETYGLDPEDVLKKITSKTKAIIAVHIGGYPCKIRELKKIADDYGLFLIEDACEALGSKIGNKMVGTFGDVSAISFCNNKIITTGEGGAVLTNRKSIATIIERLVSHGEVNYKFLDLGYNWRLPTMLASLGISQLEKIDENISQRQNNVSYLNYKIFGEELNLLKDYFHTYQLFIINLGKNRDRVKRHLKKVGIGNKVYFEPIHLSHYYKSVLGYNIKLPITEKISKEVLTLPNYPDLTRKEMDKISEEIWKVIF